MSDAFASMLRYAVGNPMPIRLSMRDGAGVTSQFQIDTPYAIVGRARDCDVSVVDESVAFRHVYLQMIGPRLACIDLLSIGGIEWTGPPFHAWVSPQHGLKVGTAELRLQDDGWVADSLKSPLDFKPRAEMRAEYGILPQVNLELLNTASKGTVWPINRIITLLGRDERCRITCLDENISKVHCSFLLLPTGLWVIDLLGKGGVKLNGEPVRCGLLSPDCQLEIGPYQLRPTYSVPQSPAPPPPPTEVGDASRVAFLTRLNRLFRVEVYGDVLIVLPVGDLQHVNYREIHVESSRISELQATQGFKHVIVDGSYAPILGSMVLDAIIGFCRGTRGRAAFCSLSPDVFASVQGMNLDRIWPCFTTRQEALHHVFTS